MEYVIAVELLPVHVQNWIHKLDKQRSKWIHNPIGVDFGRLHINKPKKRRINSAVLLEKQWLRHWYVSTAIWW